MLNYIEIVMIKKIDISLKLLKNAPYFPLWGQHGRVVYSISSRTHAPQKTWVRILWIPTSFSYFEQINHGDGRRRYKFDWLRARRSQVLVKKKLKFPIKSSVSTRLMQRSAAQIFCKNFNFEVSLDQS